MFAFGFPRAWDTAYDHVGAVLHWRLLRAELQVRAEPGFSGHQRGHHPADSLVPLQPWAAPWPGTCHCDSRKEYHWTLLQIIDLCWLPQSSRVSTLFLQSGKLRLREAKKFVFAAPGRASIPDPSKIHCSSHRRLFSVRFLKYSSLFCLCCRHAPVKKLVGKWGNKKEAGAVLGLPWTVPTLERMESRMLPILSSFFQERIKVNGKAGNPGGGVVTIEEAKKAKLL